MSFFSVILVSKVEYASTFESFIILPLLFRNFEIRLPLQKNKIKHTFKNERPELSFSLNHFIT